MKIINKISHNEWNGIIGKCDDATFFATPEWAEILNKTFGYKIATKLFILDDGTKILLPLMKIGKHQRFFSQYLSVPFHNYGGLFSERTLKEDEINLIIKKLKGVWPIDITIVPHPFSNNKLSTIYEADQYSTQILNLTDGFKKFWQIYHDNDQIRKSKKAEKAGIRITNDNSVRAFKDYYKMYLNSVRRWGLESPQPFELYKNICKFAQNKIKLWLALKDNKIIAGIILGYFNKMVIYWGGAYYSEYGIYRPNNLLHVEVIKHACDNGYEFYDFLPSGGITGVEKFKQSFGAKKINFYSYRITRRFKKPRFLSKLI